MASCSSNRWAACLRLRAYGFSIPSPSASLSLRGFLVPLACGQGVLRRSRRDNDEFQISRQQRGTSAVAAIWRKVRLQRHVQIEDDCLAWRDRDRRTMRAYGKAALPKVSGRRESEEHQNRT